MFVSAVIPAAGSGIRLKNSLPKPLVCLCKNPILIHTLTRLSKHPQIDEIIVVVSLSILHSFKRLLKEYRIKKIKCLVAGGRHRTDSVKNGLKHVSGNADLVFVHDGARPLIKSSIITSVIIPRWAQHPNRRILLRLPIVRSACQDSPLQPSRHLPNRPAHRIGWY